MAETKTDAMLKGMTNHSPTFCDKSTGPKAVGGGSVNKNATRDSVPKVKSPGPRTA